jgi:hypothetical protein
MEYHLRKLNKSGREAIIRHSLFSCPVVHIQEFKKMGGGGSSGIFLKKKKPKKKNQPLTQGNLSPEDPSCLLPSYACLLFQAPT